MKVLAPIAALFVLAAWSASTAETAASSAANAMPSEQTLARLHAVSPAFEKYTRDSLLGDVWKRPDLSIRDGAIVTLAVLIARNQTTNMPYHISLAPDNGVKPSEICEIIAHLACYSGWESAMAAVPILGDVFAQRGIGANQLSAASPKLLDVNEASEAKRAESAKESIGPASPGLVQYTGDLRFHDLWPRPDLAPGDHSLVTIRALIATGEFAQPPSHLGRAMDNGLTKPRLA